MLSLDSIQIKKVVYFIYELIIFGPYLELDYQSNFIAYQANFH